MLERRSRHRLVRLVPEVERERQPLPLERQADPVREPVEHLDPRVRLRNELQPVLADHLDAVDAHDPPRLVGGTAGQHADERVAAEQAAQLGACPVRNAGRGGVGDDRGQHAVDVEQDRGPLRLAGELLEQWRQRHRAEA